MVASLKSERFTHPKYGPLFINIAVYQDNGDGTGLFEIIVLDRGGSDKDLKRVTNKKEALDTYDTYLKKYKPKPLGLSVPVGEPPQKYMNIMRCYVAAALYAVETPEFKRAIEKGDGGTSNFDAPILYDMRGWRIDLFERALVIALTEKGLRPKQLHISKSHRVGVYHLGVLYGQYQGEGRTKQAQAIVNYMAAKGHNCSIDYGTD